MDAVWVILTQGRGSTEEVDQTYQIPSAVPPDAANELDITPEMKVTGNRERNATDLLISPPRFLAAEGHPRGQLPEEPAGQPPCHPFPDKLWPNRAWL